MGNYKATFGTETISGSLYDCFNWVQLRFPLIDFEVVGESINAGGSWVHRNAALNISIRAI
jgi:hypothetical protein